MDLAQNFDGLRAPLSLYLTIPHLHKQVALDYIGKTQTIEEQDTLHSNTLPSTAIIRVQHNQTPCSGHKASLEQMPFPKAFYLITYKSINRFNNIKCRFAPTKDIL